jgi:hypothetical protein
MRIEERKVIYPGGDFPTETSPELRQRVLRSRFPSDHPMYRRLMAEITRRERLGIDDISNMNAVPRRKPQKEA